MYAAVLVIMIVSNGAVYGNMFHIPMSSVQACEREAPKLKTKLLGSGNERYAKHYCLDNRSDTFNTK